MAANLTITIAGNADKFAAEMRRVRKETENLEKQLAAVAKVSAIAFVAFTASIGLATNEAIKFEKAMANVKTLLDDTSFSASTLEEGFAGMQKELLRVATRAPVAIEELSTSLFNMVSAGVDAASAVEAVAVAADLATAGGTSLNVATDGLTSALNAYELSADKATSVSAKFFTAQKFGKTTIEELSSGFGLVATSASTLGVSLDELLAAVSAATTAGIRTNQSYTGLAAVLAAVSKPTADAAKESKRLGIEFSLSALKAKGLKGFLDQLTNSNKFTADSVTKLFGSIEAQKLIFALTGAAADSFAKIVKELGDEERLLKTFLDAVNESSKTAAAEIQKLTNTFRVIAITLGNEFLPFVKAAATGMKELLIIVQDNPALIKMTAVFLGLGAAISGIVAAMATTGIGLIALRAGLIALAPAMAGARTGAIALSVSIRGIKLAIQGALAATGIGLLIIILGDLALNFEIRFKQIKAVLTNAFEFFKRLLPEMAMLFGEIALAIPTLFESISDSFGILVTLMRSEFRRLSSLLSGFIGLVQTFTGKVSEFFGGIAEKSGLVENFKRIGEIAKDQFKKLREDLRRISEEEDGKDDESAREKGDRRPGGLSKETEDEEKQAEIEEAKLKLQVALEELREQDLLFKEMTAADQELFIKNNLDLFKTEAELKKQIQEKALKAELQRERRAQAKFIQDRQQFGEAVATINKFFRGKEVQGVKAASNELVALQRSRSGALKAIGKTAAVANIIISTQESMTRVLAGFATIPIIGQALGIAAAASIAAFGAERISNVVAAKHGGIVPQIGGANPFTDSVPTITQPGELITPRRNFDEVVNSVAESRNQRAAFDEREQGLEEVEPQGVIISFDGSEAEKFLTASQNEADALGTSSGF